MSKGSGFDRLRISVAHGAIGACMVVGGMAASRAGAAEVKPLGGGTACVVRTGISWCPSNSTSTNGITGMGLTDATYTTSVATTGGSTTTLSDAFDGCEVMAVDGTSYADPDGTLDLVGNDMTGSPTTIAGLTVSRQFHWNNATLANGTAVMRSLNTFSNPGGAPITVTVAFGCNLGSDSGSIVEGTSNGSGNAPVTDDNLWFVTSDAQPYSDPPITHVRYGTGAAVTASFDTNNGPPGPGVNSFNDEYVLTVPAGGTRHILRFIGLSNGGGASLADAPTFENLASLEAVGLLSGIAPSEYDNIANYAPLGAPPPGGPLPAVPQANVIPALDRIGLLLMAALVGLVGLLGWRNRSGS